MSLIENEQKFLQFYNQYITKIYRYIYFRVGSEETAQDLSSEVFLRTWQYLKDGKEIGNLSAMTYQVCRNLISDYFRKNSDLPIPLETIADKNLKDEAAINLFEDAHQQLEIESLKKHLAVIREEYQELIIWYYVDDFPISEIAQILEKSEGAVRTSLSRALKALKEAVEAEENRGN